MRQAEIPIVWVLAAILGGCSSNANSDSPDDAIDADAAVYIGCEDAPELVIGLEVMGKNGKIRASLLDAAPSPPRKYLNLWTLQLTDADGQPLHDATVTAIRSFMPLHGHEGQPPASAQMMADDGQMLAHLNFFMRGYWEAQINLSSPSAGDDYIAFPSCVRQ